MNVRIRAGLSQTSTGKWSGDSTTEFIWDNVDIDITDEQLAQMEVKVQASRDRIADNTAAEVARRNGMNA